MKGAVVTRSPLETALAEFAQLLLGEFVVVDVLQRLCEHVITALPVMGAGVSLPGDNGLHVGWAAGPRVRELEELRVGWKGVHASRSWTRAKKCACTCPQLGSGGRITPLRRCGWVCAP